MAARSMMGLTGSAPSGKAGRRIVRGGAGGGFEVSVDKVARILRVAVRGVWDVKMVDEFGAALRVAAADLGTNSWLVLCDSREFQVQSPEVARSRQKLMTSLRNHGCEKIAVVASSAVYTMQFKRIAGESHMGSGIFSDEQSALEWLQATPTLSK